MGVIGCFYPYSAVGVYTMYGTERAVRSLVMPTPCVDPMCGHWRCAAHCSVSGVFVLLFEWPVPGVTKLGTFNENFWVRGILYILYERLPALCMAVAGCVLAHTATIVTFLVTLRAFSVAGPSFVQAASFGGACFLCVTALLYLIAAYRGESWVDPKAGEGTARRGKGGVVTADRGRPPSRPATRARPSEMEWQMSPLASDSQVDSQGYLVGKPAPRNANGAAY